MANIITLTYNPEYARYNEPAIEALAAVREWLGNDKYEFIKTELRLRHTLDAPCGIAMWAQSVAQVYGITDGFEAACMFRDIWPQCTYGGRYDETIPPFDVSSYNPFVRPLES